MSQIGTRFVSANCCAIASFSELHGLGADLVAISADTVWWHAAFVSANQLSIILLSDDQPRGKAARTYGVLNAERGLFVIHTNGMIAWSAVFPELSIRASTSLTALEAWCIEQRNIFT